MRTDFLKLSRLLPAFGLAALSACSHKEEVPSEVKRNDQVEYCAAYTVAEYGDENSRFSADRKPTQGGQLLNFMAAPEQILEKLLIYIEREVSIPGDEITMGIVLPQAASEEILSEKLVISNLASGQFHIQKESLTGSDISSDDEAQGIEVQAEGMAKTFIGCALSSADDRPPLKHRFKHYTPTHYYK